MEDSTKFIEAMKFKNGVTSEYLLKSENKYQMYLNTGTDRRPATLEDLNSLPIESYHRKDGVFVKGNSELTKFESRYFVVGGGMMTYFKNNQTSIPQGTIPLKDCTIELPNEERKSFANLGREKVKGYELRISHQQRRPFILFFESSKERNEWKVYLTNYIAQSFVSSEYRYAEAIEAVKDGVYVKKCTGVIGLDNSSSDTIVDESNQYVYIDWYSQNPSHWCLRYSLTPLQLIPSPVGESCVYQFDENVLSNELDMSHIVKVSLNESPGQSKSIKLMIYNGSNLHPRGVGEVWILTPRQETLSFLWVHAIQSALTLHERNIPTQIHRKSRTSIDTTRAQLSAPTAPRGYTRVSFLKEIYSIRHGNEFDLLGAGVQQLARDLTLSEGEGNERRSSAAPLPTTSSPSSTTTTNNGDTNLPPLPVIESLQLSDDNNDNSDESMTTTVSPPAIPSNSLTEDQKLDTL